MPALLFYGFGALFLLFLYFAQSIVYNLYFHPFRNLPGPRLARILKLWALLANLQGIRYLKIHDAHKQYGGFCIWSAVSIIQMKPGAETYWGTGPVVRIAPNELSFADPSVVREIYMSNFFLKEPSFYVGSYLRIAWTFRSRSLTSISVR